MWGWGRMKQGGKRISFLLLPRALGSCLMWQVQYEPREISVVEGFEAAALLCTDGVGSSHQPWHFSRHLGLHFTVVMSWWGSSALTQVSATLSSNHWPTCWQKMSDLLCGSLTNCGIEHVKPGSSGGSLQKQLLYTKSRCYLNKETTVSFHITLYHLHIWLLSDLLQFLWKVKNILLHEQPSGGLI